MPGEAGGGTIPRGRSRVGKPVRRGRIGRAHLVQVEGGAAVGRHEAHDLAGRMAPRNLVGSVFGGRHSDQPAGGVEHDARRHPEAASRRKLRALAQDDAAPAPVARRCAEDIGAHAA